MSLALDHLVVAAPSLEVGVRWCEATLGHAPSAGGTHALMGTHNRVASIGCAAFPRAYLEIIAIDPAAPPPGRARWFGLDTLDLRDGPRLVHWVARTDELDARLAALAARGCGAGRATALSRATPDGVLSWRIAVRDDGQLLADGAWPTLIEWGATHPADTLPPSGITLQGMTLRGVPTGWAAMLGRGGAVTLEALPGPAIAATFDTPRGRVTLHSA